jgi:hypothetical protein
MADHQDHHQNDDADQRPPVWASMRYVEDAYGLSHSTQRNLSRLGKIEMVRLIGTGGGKLVRVNLRSVDQYFASLPKVEPGTGRWLGPKRTKAHYRTKELGSSRTSPAISTTGSSPRLIYVSTMNSSGRNRLRN